MDNEEKNPLETVKADTVKTESNPEEISLEAFIPEEFKEWMRSWGDGEGWFAIRSLRKYMPEYFEADYNLAAHTFLQMDMYNMYISRVDSEGGCPASYDYDEEGREYPHPEQLPDYLYIRLVPFGGCDNDSNNPEITFFDFRERQASPQLCHFCDILYALDYLYGEKGHRLANLDKLAPWVAHAQKLEQHCRLFLTPPGMNVGPEEVAESTPPSSLSHKELVLSGFLSDDEVRREAIGRLSQCFNSSEVATVVQWLCSTKQVSTATSGTKAFIRALLPFCTSMKKYQNPHETLRKAIVNKTCG